MSVLKIKVNNEWINIPSIKGEAGTTDYNELENKPSIPSKTSQLTNDSNFLTSHQDISGKQNISSLETDVKAFINKTYIESLIDDGSEVEY